MNKANLLRMADYIATVPQNVFSMSMWRTNLQETTHECNSVGCIIGHCTILDGENLHKFIDESGIDYPNWGENFTGLKGCAAEWRYMFGASWKFVDNTPTGAAKRIRYVVENGVPLSWDEEMFGEQPLSY